MSDTQSKDWAALRNQLKDYKRPTWIPEVAAQSADPLASKFSGIPALAQAETWPLCQHCNTPMQLFVQLNAKDFPDGYQAPFQHGLLQAFYCTNDAAECEFHCDAYLPFAKSTLVRLVNYSAATLASPHASPVKDAFPEKVITGWQEADDYPNWEELSTMGIELSDAQADLLIDLDYPKSNDKLFGWPNWIQGIEYPDCPICNQTMQLVFQIDSNDNLPYMFGDVGCAHITQCKQHPDSLAIAWACS